jgi:hypothetical protein
MNSVTLSFDLNDGWLTAKFLALSREQAQAAAFTNCSNRMQPVHGPCCRLTFPITTKNLRHHSGTYDRNRRREVENGAYTRISVVQCSAKTLKLLQNIPALLDGSMTYIIKR